MQCSGMGMQKSERGTWWFPLVASIGIDPRIVTIWSPSHRGVFSIAWGAVRIPQMTAAKLFSRVANQLVDDANRRTFLPAFEHDQHF